MEKKFKVNTSKRTLMIVLCVVLSIILALVVTGIIIWKDLFGQIGRLDESVETLSSELEESIRNETDPTDPGFTGPIIDSGDVTVPTEPVETVPDSDMVMNILLIGQDRRAGQGRQRSDSMILCTINKSTKTLTMTSFLRDTWVYIPDRYYERLNVPYAIGGHTLLYKTLEYNFGVSVDNCFEADFSGFEALINLVGGVDINLTAAEANYLSGRNKAWNFEKGVNHLNGAQALDYSRIRALDNDMGRSNRQRNVITALINKAKTMSVNQLYDLVKQALSYVKTDMTDADILTYTKELAPMLADMQIVSQRIPADGAYSFARIDGKSVIYLSPENLKKNIEILQNTVLVQ